MEELVVDSKLGIVLLEFFVTIAKAMVSPFLRMFPKRTRSFAFLMANRDLS